jgi:hypothetical protein
VLFGMDGWMGMVVMIVMCRFVESTNRYCIGLYETHCILMSWYADIVHVEVFVIV